MRINSIRTIAISTITALSPLVTIPVFSQAPKADVFEYAVPPSGTNDSTVLAGAPSPAVKVCGEEKTAAIVVDLKNNILYKYDKFGNAENAYLIASGAKETPTHKGVRIVSHVETYPYRGAPPRSKRRRSPRAFGPKAIILNKLDVKTGEQSSTGEFIHGNNDANSIGKYASHGCMRMDNEVIQQLAKEVKRGDIVVIK